jgi:hypothetical protein
LQAITLNPARMLGVADRLGSLEVGKAAYVIVFSGDPLDFNSWIEKAYIKGVLAYDRDQDVRLKKLLGLEPRFKELATKQAPAKKQPTKKPVAKKPAVKKPAVKQPAEAKPAANKPTDKQPEKKPEKKKVIDKARPAVSAGEER